jgi:MYXO-CTERM domain-containing protein
VTTNIAIRLAFTITAGDSASFTSLFVVVPAPAGAFAMLGLVGLAGGRRRRS